MAKAPRKKAAPQRGPEAANKGKPEARPQFRFNAFHLTRLTFVEVASALPAESTMAAGSDGHATMGVQLALRVSEDSENTELTMRMSVAPGGSAKPYQIEVEVVGEFSVVNGTREQLEKFTRENAPVILFPYIRSIIDHTTSDGRFGGLRLHPTNLQSLIGPGGWTTRE